MAHCRDIGFISGSGRYPKRIRAAAYAYADGGPIPRELILLHNIEKYGAQAVLGRTLGAGEIRRMNVAENIVRAYQSRKQSDNWATWAEVNPELNRILEDAMLAEREDGE